LARPGEVKACPECGQPVEYVEYYAFNGVDYDVLDSWWSHRWEQGECSFG
jgi:hypothetical protein